MMETRLRTKQKVARSPSFASVRGSVIQRKCACGGTVGPTGECEACRTKRLQRRSLSSISQPPSSVSEGLPIVHEVLRPPGRPLDSDMRAFVEPRFGHDFGNLRPHTTATTAGCKSKEPIKARLSIGVSDDPLEREADRIADQVLAAPAHSALSGAPPHIQRFAGRPTGYVATAPASVNRVLANSGSSLEPTLRQDMEQRFGHDFSQVRVHSGGAAEQSARDVCANAYAVGHHIVFGADQFVPETHWGRRLIAHELAHVIQQSGAQRIQVDGGKERDSSRSISEDDHTVAPQVVAGTERVLVQREPCESLAPPNCSSGTCEEGKQCVGYDWPVCACWSTADDGENGSEDGGGTSGGGGSTESW
jgi:Domain of unknown function (DUF4157)